MNQVFDIPDFHALLRLHAKAHPDAVAVADGTREICYAQFEADIEKIARRLNSHGLPPRTRAVLYITNPYLHWLAIIALWRLGVISASVNNPGEPGLLKLLRANVLITDHADLRADGRGVIAIEDDWLDENQSASADAWPPASELPFDAQQPVRILLSSGTTGLPKKIPYTNAIIAARIKYTLAKYHLGPQHRFMSVAGANTVTGYIDSITTWAAGGSVALIDMQEPFDRLFARMRPNLVFMSPAQIAGIIDTLPPDFPHCGLTLIVGGGRLQEAVAQRAMQRLASAIWLLYGSTETGMVAFSDAPDHTNPEAVWTVVPNAEVKIVDEAGHTLPRGTIGKVCIRGVCCVEFYLDDAEISRSFFRDGWFYPGDIGTLSEAGQLSIVGRADDVMNLGGTKVAPGAIEDLLLSCPGVKDAAVFFMPDGLGTEELWVAVSASAGDTLQELRRRYQARFPDYPTPHVAFIDAIPRNDMAKVQRKLLRNMVEARLAGKPL